MFTLLTTIAILLAVLFMGWAVWFLFEFLRYLVSGDYEVDKRLENVTHRRIR